MNLAENLKKIRKDHNLSQEQLAEQLGVSRQSVSKWESNQAYPEMDKVIQLAKMFNLNVDELLNQDIREVNSEKQSKITINKYIDDFLSFITKTVDMFSSMKWKFRLKCILEQFIVICVLLLIFLIIGAISHSVLSGLISMLPDSISNIICSIGESVYIIISLILGIILLIHIFKVRYLDYYVIVKEDNSIQEVENNTVEKLEEEEQVIPEKNSKIYLEKKKEKVIIRDPKHSEYKFISGMLKGLLFCIKAIVFMIALSFSISLICFVLSLVISFLVIKTGLFFWGIFLAILACILINIIVLIILFNFIMNRKNHKRYLLISFILSLVLLGIGGGITMIGLTEFDYIDDINNEIYLKDEIIISMQNDLMIYSHYDDMIEYIEEDRSDIKIVYKHTNQYDLSYLNDFENYLYLNYKTVNDNVFKTVREQIKDINQKKIINYSKFKVYICTSKENIDKLKNNRNNYLKELNEKNDYTDYLYEKNIEYENRIYELEEELRNRNQEIENLKMELNNN